MKILVILCFFVTSCSLSKLTDLSNNSFSLNVSQGEYKDCIKITWTKISQYEYYEVYRSESPTDEYINISLKIKGSQYVDRNIEKGKIYYYKVRAFNKNDFLLFNTIPSSGYAGVEETFSAPHYITASEGEFISKIVVNWTKINKALKYRICRSTDGENFEQIAEVPYLYYEDKNVVPYQIYYYQIISISSEGYPSPNNSKIVKGMLFDDKINFKTIAGQFYDKILLTWNKHASASSYCLYRSTSPKSIGELIASIQNSYSYEDINVEKGKIYYYTLFAKHNQSIQKLNSIKSYLKTETSPGKVNGLNASEGQYESEIRLTWNSVLTAKNYEVCRFDVKDQSWKSLAIVTDTFYTDDQLDDGFVYDYRVTAMNPAMGEYSEIVKGWANKPPTNINASKDLGNKVILSWDKIPNVTQYNIFSSDSKDGTYKFISSINPNLNNKDQEIFEHITDIGNLVTKTFYYKIAVVNNFGISKNSEIIQGIIKKIEAPQSLRIINNKSTESAIKISWNSMQGVKEYRVYRVALKHLTANPNNILPSEFRLVATVKNNFYQDSLMSFPLRKYIYRVHAVDKAGNEGAGATTEIAWRLPDTIEEFIKDVDVTILHAQKQIQGFGNNGSSAVIQGRSGGNYTYAAGFSSSKSSWNHYASFEIVLNGNPKLSIGLRPPGAYMNGTINITGLYQGSVTYNNLFGTEGGYTAGGSISALYVHPTKGMLRGSWNYSEAGGLLNSVVLKQESKPKFPDFEEGGG